ncbi:UNVERIFIED_CONTAM: hypothetical protein ABID98_003666 [Brevibacillus sp. OAP136]
MLSNGKSITSKKGLEMLEEVRRICRSLPEVEEIVDGFGHTTCKVKGKSFIIMGDSDEGPSLSFKSNRENQAFLIQQEPFFKTPYIGQHGWVSVKQPENWEILEGLIKEAYLRAAPKRLVEQVLGKR